MQSSNVPTTFVVFGATGDLMQKKITPALYNLHRNKVLPKIFQVIGFSRRELTKDQFQDHIVEILKKSTATGGDEKHFQEFSKMFSYQKGDFTQTKAYGNLANVLGKSDDKWKVCANKLFYLAVPPKYYDDIFVNLSESGLTKPCGKEEARPQRLATSDGGLGWTRVLVEKPFGKDLDSAQELDEKLGKLFREEQIYRIDHYLAKEMLQNILAFRFSNNLLEESWNNQHIEKITVRLLEKRGAEGRGPFYDSVGALRDVGQNHLLQMISLVTMEHPRTLSSADVREKRSDLLKLIRPPKDMKAATYRAQYSGYRNIEGVDPESRTETYFKVALNIDSPRWRGVPIIVESGKAMRDQIKEIVVDFKHPVPCYCPPDAKDEYRNKIVFSIEPSEDIRVDLWSKKPGYALKFRKQTFKLPYSNEVAESQYTQEYEKLLLDAISGDQTLFARTDGVAAMWKVVDPIVEAWENNLVDLDTYEKGTNASQEKSKYMEEGVVPELDKAIGVIGLGKMGTNIARHLSEKEWRVVGYNRSPEVTRELSEGAIEGAFSLEELVEKLPTPRIIWVMVPAGKPVDETITKLSNVLENGDVVIDGGNTFYKDAARHAGVLAEKGVDYVDVGVSGGPEGARNGACLMVGGNRKLYDHLYPLFSDMAVVGGVGFFEGIGAGHFVKMVHNGIEYGMMQAIAEGFDVMGKSKYNLNLTEIARVYNNGSVIESKLISWMKSGFDKFGADLKGVAGSAGSGGSGAGGADKKSEGAWTVDAADELGVSARVMQEALEARKNSRSNPGFQGKIINALRNQFGGHSVESKKKT